MSINDHWRGTASPVAPPGNEWTLLDYQANHRLAELLIEAEQDRLVRLAREVRRDRPDRAHPGTRDGLIRSALSAVAAFARRSTIDRQEIPSG